MNNSNAVSITSPKAGLIYVLYEDGSIYEKHQYFDIDDGGKRKWANNFIMNANEGSK
jgi:hypothetical protein